MGPPLESEEELTKRSSCMFCLPLKKGECTPFKHNTKIHNFFPTEQSSSMRGFLHVSFDLTRDRKRLLLWGDQNLSWRGKKIKKENLKLIDQTIKLLLSDVINDPAVSPTTALKTFQDIALVDKNEDTKGKPVEHLKLEFFNALREHEFIPTSSGKTVSPIETYLHSHGLLECISEEINPDGPCLLSNSLEPCSKILANFGSQRLDLVEALSVLVNSKLKNQSDKERGRIAKAISHYALENVWSPSFQIYRLLGALPFLKDQAGNIVSLDDGPFTNTNSVKPLSFIPIKALSKGSANTLNSLLRKN